MIYTYNHVLHIPANRRREPTFGEENDERHEKSPGILYFRRMKCSRIPYKMIEVSKVSKLPCYTCIFFVFVDPWPSCSPGATAPVAPGLQQICITPRQAQHSGKSSKFSKILETCFLHLKVSQKFIGRDSGVRRWSNVIIIFFETAGQTVAPGLQNCSPG